MSLKFGEYLEDHSLKVFLNLRAYKNKVLNLLEAYHETTSCILAPFDTDISVQFELKKECVCRNQHFLNCIMEPHITDKIEKEIENFRDYSTLNSEFPKYLLKQFLREWSIDGSEERTKAYGPILSFLKNQYPFIPDRSKVKVLIPGAGLGRLPYEVIKLGFTCQGCEFSEYMLISSDWVLNRCEDEFEIFPFLHQLVNLKSFKDVINPVKIPDEFPLRALNNQCLNTGPFSMVSGDFLDCYADPTENDSWDVVISSFFIDTAKNVIDYIKNFYRILVKGGVWINFGPLHYHFNGCADEISVELPLQEILQITQQLGFKLYKENSEEEAVKFITSQYCQFPHSMMSTVYNSAFFICIK